MRCHAAPHLFIGAGALGCFVYDSGGWRSKRLIEKEIAGKKPRERETKTFNKMKKNFIIILNNNVENRK